MGILSDLTSGGVLGTIANIVDKIIPDPIAASEAKLKLLTLQQNGELAQLTADTDLAKGQLDINVEEAKNNNLFVSGWRPFLGWVCGLGFATKYLAGPFIFILMQFVHTSIVLPPIDVSEMMPLLFGMLGLGAMRSYDKMKGTS